MSKNNYTKVEELLREQVYRMKVNAILSSTETNKQTPENTLHPAQKLISVVQQLKWMKKTDPDVYKHIKISKKEIAKLEKIVKKRRNSLKDTEAKRIEELLSMIKKYREENFSEEDDELHIVDEQERHLYKRHNVSEKWIPLDVPRN